MNILDRPLLFNISMLMFLTLTFLLAIASFKQMRNILLGLYTLWWITWYCTFVVFRYW
ncbi:MAG: hypothetical protein HY363_02410 [Candidatus Aenigmarchaeota archaeon]|nr:hypothetical protein [Candidatus Aenigmarchaeota archaeon]